MKRTFDYDGVKPALKARIPIDGIFRALDIAEERCADAGPISRRINLLKADVILRLGEQIDHWRERAGERIEIALVGAHEARDSGTFSHAANLCATSSLQCNATIRNEARSLAWRDLIAIAEEVSSAEERYKARRRHVILILQHGNASDLPMLIRLTRQVRFIEDDRVWGEERLVNLRQLLSLLRKEDKASGAVKHELALGHHAAPFLAGVRTIYKAFWRELFRLDSTDPKFQRMEAFGTFRNAANPPAMASIVSSVLEDWSADEAGNDQGWPPGVVDLLGEVAIDRTRWLEFIRAYPRYFQDPGVRGQ